LGSQEDFPLDIRTRIAIRLLYLHSSAPGIVGHGSVAASTILLDNNFRPKLTDSSGACKLIKDSGNNASKSIISNYLLKKVLYNDPSRLHRSRICSHALFPKLFIWTCLCFWVWKTVYISLVAVL
jgi:hypothetical protein